MHVHTGYHIQLQSAWGQIKSTILEVSIQSERTDNRKLQEEVNDRHSDIKNIVNSRIRSKVIFVI